MDLLFEPTRPPRAHQWRALEKAQGRPGFAYLMEMGTGKSKTWCDEMCQLFLQKRITRCLIFAGAGSYADWAEKHIPENVPRSIPHAVHLWTGGGSKTERDALNWLMRLEDTLIILVMNIEGLSSSDRSRTVSHNFVSSGPCAVCVDESSKIKDADSYRGLEAMRLGRKAIVRRAMTGSPVTNNPLDLWGQLSFLGIEQNFASNYYSFRARFCKLKAVSTGVGRINPKTGQPMPSKKRQMIVGYQNLDRLARLLEQHSFRVLKEECLDLPPKIYQVDRVELTKEQIAAYRDMHKLATVELQNEAWASAKNAMNRLQKMHRILLGHLVDDEGVLHALPTNRPERLCQLVEETDMNKVIIWCAFKEDVRLVCDALQRRWPDRKVYSYFGDTSNEMRAEAKQEFEYGDASFLVGTAATGGYGLTLVSSKNTIYYSNTYSLEHRLQSEDRNHRDGQKFAVTYVDMMVPGSIEEKIIRTLKSKKEVADEVTGDSVGEWLEWLP